FNRHAVRRYIALLLLVGTRIHVLFHSPSGVLFTFPSRYLYAIGHQSVLSLTRWSSRIQSGLHVPRLTREFPHWLQRFHLQGYHLLWRNFPVPSVNVTSSVCIT